MSSPKQVYDPQLFQPKRADLMPASGSSSTLHQSQPFLQQPVLSSYQSVQQQLVHGQSMHQPFQQSQQSSQFIQQSPQHSFQQPFQQSFQQTLHQSPSHQFSIPRFTSHPPLRQPSRPPQPIPRSHYVAAANKDYFRHREYTLCLALSFRPSARSRDFLLQNNTLKSIFWMGETVLPFIINQRQDYDICETPAIANRFFCTNKVMYEWRRNGDQAT